MYIVIDRTQWKENNLILVSLVYKRRAIPVYGAWLPKKGNSHLEQQKEVLDPVYSSFYIGLHGQNWLDSLTFFQDEMEQLMFFSPHKHSYYRKGLRAASLIQSAL